MDPISAALGIASAATATCSAVWKLCERWRDAPSDVHELKDAVLQANEFSQAVKYNMESDRMLEVVPRTFPSHNGLNKLLQDGETTLTAIRCLLETVINGSDFENQVNLSRRMKIRWLKNAPKAKKLCKKLKQTTAQTCAFLISQNITISAQLETTLRSTEKSIGDKFDTIEHGWLEYAEKLSERTCALLLTRLSNEDHHLEHAKDAAILDQTKGELLGGQPPKDNDYTTVDAFYSSSYGMLQGFDSCSGCVCACHLKPRRGRWDFQAMANVLGHISISHQGLPILGQPCTDKRCYGRQKWFKVDYYLPQWLVGAAISIFISPGPPAPEMVLRVIRQVDLDAADLSRNVFFMIARDDVEGIKTSLMKRLISPWDERMGYRTSALGTAIIHESPAIVKLLLVAGADAFQGPDDLTPAALLLNRLHFGTAAILQISSMFSVSELLDHFDYADLHRAVLGILPLDVETALRNSPQMAAQANQKTANGYTPVSLAAMRGDVASLAALTRAGADLNCRSAMGLTPLHLACRGCHVSAVEFLINHCGGEHVNDPTTIHGDSPLRMVFFKPPAMAALKVAQILLEQGANINAINKAGESAIKAAVQVDFVKGVEYLASKGADVDIADMHGFTPLIEAIFYKSHRSVRALLDNGANYMCISHRGYGVLHYLASYADAKTLQVMIDFDICHLDTKLRSKDGLTPKDCWSKRTSISDEENDMFEAIIGLLERKDTPDLAESGPQRCEALVDDCSDDEFFDAVDDLVARQDS